MNAFLSQNIEASEAALHLLVRITDSPTEVDIDVRFYENIPVENRKMDLRKFQKGITQNTSQNKMLRIAEHFIASVLDNNHLFYTIQGSSGIGKTAIAVATAKELAKNGKKVLFLSEVALSKQTAGFTYFEFMNLDTYIEALIADYDVVFMDDNNLSSLTGVSFERMVLKRFHRQVVKEYLFKTGQDLTQAMRL